MFNANLYNSPFISADLYFSFDSPQYYHKGVQNYEGHPLIYYILYPILRSGYFFKHIFNNELVKVALVNIVCVYMISSSIMFLFRYLRVIICLKKSISLLIIFFYSLFSTSIILSFTFESYTFSLYVLSFATYYYSSKVKKKKETTLSSNLFLSVLLGGITITNLAKGVILMCFTKDKLGKTCLRIMCIGGIFLIIYIYLEYKIYLEYQYSVFEHLFNRYEKFRNRDCSYYESAIDLFIGAPILLPGLLIKYSALQGYLIIIIDYYHKVWQYIFTAFLWVGIICSAIRNYKNIYVLMLLSCFATDIFLHLILKYGIDEPFIYGGHWVYIVPLLLGWYYKSLNSKYRKGFVAVLVVMTLVLFFNNINWIIDFVQYAKTLYPIYI